MLTYHLVKSMRGARECDPEWTVRGPPEDTPVEEAREIVKAVAGKAAEWAALAPAEKCKLISECRHLLQLHTTELAAAACTSRGYDSADAEQDHLTADATVISGASTAAWLRGGEELLDSLAKTGKPPPMRSSTKRPDGSYRIRVEPLMREKLMGHGHWEIVTRGAPEQFNPMEAGASVTGVLGAGNTEILNDIIDPLCRLNSVVVYKSNPVMAISNVLKEKILRPLIERGYVRFIYGGADQGRLIVESDLVDRIFVTGSHLTYDRIVWGDRDKRDEQVEPVVTKPVLAELGSVNPYIVVPGDSPWSRAQIEEQADALVAYKLSNNSHICAAPQVIVTCKQWSQRREFLDAVVAKLRAAPRAHCFYPGIARSYDKHKTAMGQRAQICGTEGSSGDAEVELVPIFQEDLQVANQPLGLQDEAFCPVLYEVAVDSAATLGDFLPKAVDLCHDQLWGNLTAMIIVDDSTKLTHEERFNEILDTMRFGTIGVNNPASIANTLPILTWGGFPCNSQRDVQSGIGQLGNFDCYKRVEKCIMYNQFSNLLNFKVSLTDEDKAQAKLRGERIAEAYAKRSMLNITRLGLAQFLGV